MATKPTTVISWAKNVNYTVGPFAGSATKLTDPVGDTEGSVPGDGIVAEFYNQNINVFGQWSVWQEAGSATAKLEAYPIEADANGTVGIAAMFIGGTASGDIACTITENSGASSSALNVTNTGTGFGITSTASGNSAAIRGLSNTDTGPTIEAICFGLGDGLRGQANSGTAVSGETITGIAGSFQVSGNGTGLDIDTIDGFGIDVDTNSGLGIIVNCNTGQCGSFFTNGGTSISAITTSVLGQGVTGRVVNAGAGATSVGVRGENTGAGQGIEAISNNGYGLKTISTNNIKAPLNLGPNAGPPSNLDEGDLFFDSNSLNFGWGYSPGNKFFGWGTTHGFSKGFQKDDAEVLIVGSIGDITMNLQSPYEPRDNTPGYLEITVEFQIQGLNGVLAQEVGWAIRDLTAPGSPIIFNSQIGSSQGGDFCNGLGPAYPFWSVVRTFRYQTPLKGARQLQLEFFHAGGGNDYNIRKRVLKAIGMFDNGGA